MTPRSDRPVSPVTRLGLRLSRAVLWTLCLCLLGLGRAVAPAVAADLMEVIPRIKPSVVGIGTHQELRRPPARLYGTGFAIGDGTLVATNMHVASVSIDRRRGERLVAFVGMGNNAKLVPVSLVASDPAHDIAFLRLSTGRLKPLVLGDGERVREGQQIAFTGFPIGAVLGLYPVTHRGIISARTPIAIPQVSPRRLDPKMIKRLRQGFEVFQLDATAYPGNSGSPLYDAHTGEVYGIVSSVFVKETKEKVLSDPSGITYAVPVRYVRRLLETLPGATGGGR